MTMLAILCSLGLVDAPPGPDREITLDSPVEEARGRLAALRIRCEDSAVPDLTQEGLQNLDHDVDITAQAIACAEVARHAQPPAVRNWDDFQGTIAALSGRAGWPEWTRAARSDMTRRLWRAAAARPARRRIGEEIEVRRNETGQDELFMREAAPPAPAVRTAAADVTADPRTFFSSLDPDAFSTEEDQLRDAVFELLARWKSREQATYADLAGDTGVRRAVAAVRPPEVVL